MLVLQDCINKLADFKAAFSQKYEMNKFKYSLLLIMIVTSYTSLAQNITKVVDKNASFIAISAESTTMGYKNITIILKDKKAAKFANNLREEMSLFAKWSNIAINNNITEYKKALLKTYNIDHILFDFDDKTYCAYAKSVDPMFIIDKDGNISLNIQGDFRGSIGTDYYMTTSGIIIGGGVVSGNSSESSLMKRVSFNYSINLLKDDIFPWLEKLDNLVTDLKTEKKELQKSEKQKEKLFK